MVVVKSKERREKRMIEWKQEFHDWVRFLLSTTHSPTTRVERRKMSIFLHLPPSAEPQYVKHNLNKRSKFRPNLTTLFHHTGDFVILGSTRKSWNARIMNSGITLCSKPQNGSKDFQSPVFEQICITISTFFFRKVQGICFEFSLPNKITNKLEP